MERKCVTYEKTGVMRNTCFLKIALFMSTFFDKTDDSIDWALL